MIRRVLVQSDAHKAPQRQRVRQPPGNPALRPDALEIPDQQRPKVNPRRQRRTPVLGRIELRTPLLDKLVEALGLQQLIQTLIKRMPWSRRQLGVRDPDLLLLLPLLARPHRHAPILQTNSVDTVKVLAYEPGLAPRAAKEHAFDGSFFAAGHVAPPNRWRQECYTWGAHARNVTIQTAPLHRCLTIAAPVTLRRSGEGAIGTAPELVVGAKRA